MDSNFKNLFNWATNGTNQETSGSAHTIGQTEKEMGYTSPTQQQPGESWDHYVKRENTFYNR